MSEKRLKTGSESGDRLYRLYGNQFAIIWDEIRDRGHALDTATAILDDLTSLVEIDASNLYMGVSLEW
jgi:predicted signal transduction protein with EAL and GGDEF domain